MATDLIDNLTPERLATLLATLENSKTTIDGLNSTVATQGATITDLTNRLATAEGRLTDPNLVAVWGQIETAQTALQSVLVAPSPAPQGPVSSPPPS